MNFESVPQTNMQSNIDYINREACLDQLEGRSNSPHMHLDRDKLLHSRDPLYADACEDYINTVTLRYKSYKQVNASLHCRTQKYTASHIRLSECTTPFIAAYAYRRHDQDSVTVSTAHRKMHVIKQVLQFSTLGNLI